jgi:predicted secreted Zn-dependent protease
MAKKIGCEPCGMDDWETERDLEALTRANSVKKDPERMKKVKALAKKRLEENKQRRDQAQEMVDLGEGKDITA